MNLNEFLRKERLAVIGDLSWAKASINSEADIRLCVDKKRDGFEWLLRLGPVEYDTRHSDYCAASTLTPDTDVWELAEELIKQLG